MKRALLSSALLLAFASLAFAHLGSPNVFFEGPAGAYSVYAVVRPPAAFPGPAQVSVRVRNPDIQSVSLLPVMWHSGREGSPLPVMAQRVPGEANLWSAEVWLLRPGSYVIQIGIDGAQGVGEATVPLNAIGRQTQQMTTGLEATLIGFGLLLFLSAVLIVGAVVRDGSLDASESPDARNSARGRRACGIAALLLASGAAAGAVRWRNMDLAYRAFGTQKPEPVAVAVRTEADRIILELRQVAQLTPGPSWAALLPDHGKLMHVFLIREPELEVFAHLHPMRQNADTFALEAPALPAGGYHLYGEITYENGINQTLIAHVGIPEPVGTPLALPPLAPNTGGDVICGFPSGPASTSGPLTRDLDDSWHAGRSTQTGFASPEMRRLPGGGLVSRLMGGHTLLFENAEAVASGRASSLRFAAFAADGSEAVIQPYMGMLGHAAVRRVDGSVFAHLHPLGSFSMASQEAFRRREAATGPGTDTMVRDSRIPSTNRVSFPYQFPKAGPYRIWVQVRIAGRVFTGVYDLEINATG